MNTPKVKSKKKGCLATLFIQFIILIVLLFISEGIVRLSTDWVAGVMYDDQLPVDSVIYEERFFTDEEGIMRYVKNSDYLPGEYKINAEGFRSSFDFSPILIDSLSKEKAAKKIMLIGDSYVEGCCAKPIGLSFPDLLGKEENLFLINFGVGATDPVQYRLLIEKYADSLNPDLIVVCVYLGNDILEEIRVPKPGVPLYYAIKDFGWISAIKPPHLRFDDKDPYMHSPEEAYEFTIELYTLKGNRTAAFEKLFSHSVILSKLWLNLRMKMRKMHYYESHPLERPPLSTSRILNQIQSYCKEHNHEVLFVAIPSPMDAENNLKPEEAYEYVFRGTDWSAPNINSFSLKDYDGTLEMNHFNNVGHEKYFNFLLPEINRKLQQAK